MPLDTNIIAMNAKMMVMAPVVHIRTLTIHTSILYYGIIVLQVQVSWLKNRKFAWFEIWNQILFNNIFLYGMFGIQLRNSMIFWGMWNDLCIMYVRLSNTNVISLMSLLIFERYILCKKYRNNFEKERIGVAIWILSLSKITGKHS